MKSKALRRQSRIQEIITVSATLRLQPESRAATDSVLSLRVVCERSFREMFAFRETNTFSEGDFNCSLNQINLFSKVCLSVSQVSVYPWNTVEGLSNTECFYLSLHHLGNLRGSSRQSLATLLCIPSLRKRGRYTLWFSAWSHWSRRRNRNSSWTTRSTRHPLRKRTVTKNR